MISNYPSYNSRAHQSPHTQAHNPPDRPYRSKFRFPSRVPKPAIIVSPFRGQRLGDCPGITDSVDLDNSQRTPFPS
ncbi:uncharacterized protein BDV17DRAFT_249055 [Aspergillus undulatus]|uniref:uncharacterized protein n=1 Tax=Aspergillus undulatus TaxID=1810928 RepID=UPI003CCE1D56